MIWMYSQMPTKKSVCFSINIYYLKIIGGLTADGVIKS